MGPGGWESGLRQWRAVGGREMFASTHGGTGRKVSGGVTAASLRSVIRANENGGTAAAVTLGLDCK